MGVPCSSLLWCAVSYVLSSFAIIMTRKREQVDLLVFWMSCYCICPLALSHGASLHVVIVVFSDHTYLLFVFIWSQFSRNTHTPAQLQQFTKSLLHDLPSWAEKK